MAAMFGRLFPSSLSLFPLPKEAGTTSADSYDTHFSSIINGVISQISQIPSIRVPRNLPAGAAKALFSLFGQYQLDPSGASSSHPALDSFRRITDAYVYKTYGADNIIEIGPSLTRMAARQDQCASHSCSPNIDGRDRARALLAANIAAGKPNHPHQQDLLARGNLQYGNPVWMCDQLGQNCQVQGRILYSSFSLQDETPTTLVQAMRSHGSSIALVSLELPVGLDYVDSFQEVDTGAMWKLVDGKAQCNPGFGDAGYSHDHARLKQWMSGFTGLPLFAEVLYQFGSAVLFRFTLTGDENGCEGYPLLLKTMLEKYAYIEGDTAGIAPFLTSASHFDRLVAYLTTHHDKFAANLFKAALERVSVLTPAIVLGDDKYTDRWVLTTDQRISVAMAACIDVQKMMHRTTLGQRYLDTVNSQLATSARRAEASIEPDLAGRILAWARGEQIVTSARTVGDWVADQLDTRSARSLAQTTHLPDHIQVENGSSGVALQQPVQPIANVGPGNAQQPPAYAAFVPHRLGYPAIDAAWPFMPEHWLVAQQGMPARRGGRLINVFDPAVNRANALANLNGRAVNALTTLQQRAVNNWDWDPQTCIDLFIVGPAGTGKSTHARRIAPQGTCVVVPTNELQQHWQASYPGHAVFTLDEACANIHMVRAATCIIIDEVYQFPIGHVITLASLNIPVIALGAPDQRRYNDILGQRFAHDLVPIDHTVVTHTVHRFGQDITNILNNRAVPIYVNEFGLALPQNFAFVTTQPGVNNIQVGNAQRPGLHLTFHRGNTNVFNGTITIDSSQGTDAANVYVHLFPGDELAFAQNQYAFTLALTRCTQTITFTVPAGTRNNSALVQAMLRHGLRQHHIVRRGATVFGSRLDAINHGFSSLDDLEIHELEEDMRPADLNVHNATVQTQWFMERPIVVEQDDEDANDTPTLNLITPGLREALYAIHPEPPQPADLTRDKTMIRFRKPDPACRIRVPEWIQSTDLHEPTLYSHIGYPFSNTEILASVLAVFDRYTKPQNVAIPNKRAFMLADFMFDRWVSAFIRPDAVVKVPSVAAMFASWFDRANALRIAKVAEELPYIDSSRVLQNQYFLKCQCKPKFKAFGFCTECGQGILATNKLVNATVCPLITQATKIMQAMFKPGVIYDSGYSSDQLDDAVRATGAHKADKCMSIDLSQQDSSHINVHRYFIAKVLAFLGFDDTIITFYLISRARRFCKGLTMLGLMFEVIERLFSGEPGTALFNFLMSTGTSVCTFDFSKFTLFIGKGDDNTTVPPLPRLKLAINMVKETGVTQKIDVFPYLDFANRIFCKTGRSFMDPARALAKYTMRMSKRDNTENECIAFQDLNLICNDQEHEELTVAVMIKHKIEYVYAHDIVSAVQSLSHPATYYANLRPSKCPVEFMPTIRKSGKNEVLFEDLRDRCAPEAIAFIADVPVNDVINYVALLRLQHGTHPDVRAANRSSKFHDAFFMSGDELKLAAAKFGVRRSGSDLSLKVEGAHVIVVRGKHSWRQQVGKSLYGSAVPNIILLSIICCLAAFAYERRKVVLQACVNRLNEICEQIQTFLLVYVKLLGPVAFILSSSPAICWLLYMDSLWTAVYIWFTCQFLLRLLLLPFHFRNLQAQKNKRVATARVEHAIYGSANVRSFIVDRWLLGIALSLLVILGAWQCWVDIAVMFNLISDAKSLGWIADEMIMFVLFLITAVLAAIAHANAIASGAPLFFLVGYLHSQRVFGVWQLYLLVGWVGEIACSYLFGWSYFQIHHAPFLILFYLLGYFLAQYTVAVYTKHHARVFYWFTFFYYLKSWTSWAVPYVVAWHTDGHEHWTDWMNSNIGVLDDQRFKRRKWQWPDFLGMWRRHKPGWFRNADPVEEYMDRCVRVVVERRGKAGREFWRQCHPDKMPNFGAQCMESLARVIGYGEQQRPGSCI